MRYLPINIDLSNKPCLVVGGSELAAGKIYRLIEAGAQITVVAPSLCDSIVEMHRSGKISVNLRAFQADDLQHAKFVIAASNDSCVNLQVAREADARGLWCSSAENVGENSVTFPTLINRDPVTIAISSGGTAPVLEQVLSAQIDALVPGSTAKLAELSAEIEQEVNDRIASVEMRNRFWNQVTTGKVAKLLQSENETAARAELEKLLNHTDTADSPIGEVYLVGAGPGDPDLLTLRALRLIQQAEVVLHDRLVSDSILAMCPSSAEFVYVGKERASHAMRQQNINQALVKYARQGKRVLRLKGGDPFIFGRGGEEIETLAENGIDFQVVPGITAASGCASYAGIPLTHREYAQSCVFVTGQLKNGTIDLPWNSLAIPSQTIVCYMGLVGLPHMCESLINANLPADTPAALIEGGTRSNQRVIVGTLSSLPGLVAEQSVKAPTLIIIGQVVRLREQLAWFDSKGESL